MCSGNILALPNILSYRTNDVILVDTTKDIEFTINNYMDILPKVVQDIWFGYIKNQLPSFLKNTEVNTTFVVSTDLPTDYKYIYEELKLDEKAQKEPNEIIKIDGDNVVHKESLLFHEKHNLMFPNYKLVKLSNQEHSNILKGDELFDLVYAHSTI
jgi:hypothetical protein